MLKNYFKIAIKVLLRRKFFTFVNLFGVSFTLIVLMVVTAMFDHLINPTGPEKNSDRYLLVSRIMMKSPDRNSSTTSSPGYRFLERHVRTLSTPEKVGVFSRREGVLSFLDGRKIVSEAKRTDGVFWQILDFEFLEGGPITDAHERNADFVAVINEDTRKTFFGQETAVGKSIVLDSRSFRVIGVVKNASYFEETAYADVYVPISTSKTSEYKNAMVGDFNALVAIGPGASKAQIKDEFRAMLDHVDYIDPKRFNWTMSSVDTKLEQMARGALNEDDKFEASTGKFLAMNIAMMILFMLLPTINLININVSRILERSSEIGIRKSFGASSSTLVGQFVVENIILTAIGGVIGFLGAYVLLEVLTGSGLVPHADFSINARVFGYAILLVVFFGMFSGVYPAWKMSRLHPVDALRGRA